MAAQPGQSNSRNDSSHIWADPVPAPPQTPKLAPIGFCSQGRFVPCGPMTPDAFVVHQPMAMITAAARKYHHEDMTEDMSEDLPVTKRINVMVGSLEVK